MKLFVTRIRPASSLLMSNSALAATSRPIPSLRVTQPAADFCEDLQLVVQGHVKSYAAIEIKWSRGEALMRDESERCLWVRFSKPCRPVP